MNIIICGAGQVGFNLAKYLAGRNHNITVIDIDPLLIDQINDRLDVKAIRGHASHPDVLKRAGIDTTDMIIALTRQDEVNMVACQIAHSIFKVPKKIARIRSRAYQSASGLGLFDNDHMPIDYIISPESEVAHALSRGLAVPGAFDVTPLADRRVKMLGVRCLSSTPIVNTPITHIPSLFPEAEFTIVGITRGERKIVPTPKEILKPGDEVFYLVDQARIAASLAAFDQTGDTIKRLLIMGGGNIGLHFAREVESHYPHIRVTIIEQNKVRASLIAQRLSKSLVINGDALDSDVLIEAGIPNIDMAVAVTEDDRVNTLATVLAKRLGAQNAMCLTNKSSFGHLVKSLGANAVINPRVVTVSKIMQYIRRSNLNSVHSLGENFGEVIDINAIHAPKLVGKSVKTLQETEHILVGAVIQNEQVIIPKPTTTIKVDDRLILMLPAAQARNSELLLGIENA